MSPCRRGVAGPAATGLMASVVLYHAGAGAVAAGAGLQLGLEDEHLGDRPDRVREPDPVRQHAAVLVPDQVADRHDITPAGLAWLPVVNRETGCQPAYRRPNAYTLSLLVGAVKHAVPQYPEPQ